MGDIRRFPLRAIPRGEAPPFEFHAATPGRYDTVFAPVGIASEGTTERVDFETFLRDRGTYAFLVVRRDTLIFERYFAGRTRGSVETTFSISKSLVSLAVGLARDQGLLSVDEPITRLVPELRRRDPGFDSLTLGHLLTMTSGIRFKRSKWPWGDEATAYYDPNLRSVAVARDLAEPPGTRFQYNFYSPIVLGLALERATGRSLSETLAEGVWSRIGALTDASWSLDSEKRGFEKMESGFNATAIDLAKLGRLYARGGDWDGARIVSEEWVRASTRPDTTAGRSPNYGYFWWLRPTEGEATRYYAEGRFGQFVYVVPDRGLVIVRTGGSDGDVDWVSLFEGLIRRVDAVDGREAGGG